VSESADDESDPRPELVAGFPIVPITRFLVLPGQFVDDDAWQVIVAVVISRSLVSHCFPLQKSRPFLTSLV